jgi:hypothetical protein
LTDDEERSKGRLRAGPTEAGGVCPFHDEDVRYTPRDEFGMERSLEATYDLLPRLGVESLRPRPRHPAANASAQEAFKVASRVGSRTEADHPGERVEVWVERGTRPTAPKQTTYVGRSWLFVHLFSRPMTVRPITGSPPRPPPTRIVGYEVNDSMSITDRDVNKVGELLDATVKTGVNKIEHLSFRVSDPKPILRDLRKQAPIDARTKAAEVAQECGMGLGSPVSIEVDNTRSSSSDARYNIVERPRDMTNVPTAAGTERLRVTAGVIFELKPPG